MCVSTYCLSFPKPLFFLFDVQTLVFLFNYVQLVSIITCTLILCTTCTHTHVPCFLYGRTRSLSHLLPRKSRKSNVCTLLHLCIIVRVSLNWYIYLWRCALILCSRCALFGSSPASWQCVCACIFYILHVQVIICMLCTCTCSIYMRLVPHAPGSACLSMCVV